MACRCKGKRVPLQASSGAAASILLKSGAVVNSVNGPVRLRAGEQNVVYQRDLAQWIRTGLRGVRFVDQKEEEEFLSANKDISRDDYAV